MKKLTLTLATLMIALLTLAGGAAACPNGPKGARCSGLTKPPIFALRPVDPVRVQRVDLTEYLRQQLPSELRHGDWRSIARLVARLEIVKSPTASNRGVTVRVVFKVPVRYRVVCCLATHCKCAPFYDVTHVDIQVPGYARGLYQLSLPGVAPLFTFVP